MPVIWKAFWLRGWETVEQAEVTFALTPSSVDIEDIVEADTTTLALTSFNPEFYVVPIISIPSDTEVYTTSDADTERVSLTPTDTQALAGADTNTENFTFRPNVNQEIAQYVETPADIYITPNLLAAAQVPTTTQWVAQSFIPSANALLRTIEVYLRGTPTPDGNTIIELRQDNANKPGTVIATWTFSNAGLISNFRFIQSAMAEDLTLIGGTRYWIAIHRDTTTGVVGWGTPGADVYANGSTSISVNSGSTWPTSNTSDEIFGIRFDPEPTDIPLKFTPTAAEEYTTFDANTDRLNLTPTDTQVFTGVDADTEALAFTPTASDIAAFIDEAAERLALLALSDDTANLTEQATENFLFTTSVSEFASFVDSATERIALDPSGTDTFLPGTGGPTPTIDADTEYFSFIPSITEELTHADADTERLELTVNSSDTGQTQDSGEKDLLLSPTTDDTAQFADDASELLNLLPTFTETQQRTDADIGDIRFVPLSTEFPEFTDANSLYLRLTPAAYELYKIYELIATIGELRWRGSIVFQHYFSKLDELIYSGAIMFKRWWAKT